MRGLWIAISLVLFFWLALLTSGSLSLDPTPVTPVVRPAEPLPRATRSEVPLNGIAEVTYAWHILTSRGERHPIESRFEIDRHRVLTTIASFGIPANTSAVTLRARTQRELDLMKQRHTQQTLAAAAQRGLILRDDGWMADYRWMVARSQADLAVPTRILVETARQAGKGDGRELLGVLATFVQSLEYAVQEPERISPTGGLLRTCGVNMPLETVYRGFGDCDTKSVLLATFLANLQGMGVVFLIGNGHAFVGVRGPPRPGDRFVTIQGVHHVLIETTSFWPVGRIPDLHWNGVGRNEFEIIRIL
jgi:hypothetical protein